MNHADPWDEVARLERRMEVELLAPLGDPPIKKSEDRPARERSSTDLRPPIRVDSAPS
jgi:hypothetical protein